MKHINIGCDFRCLGCGGEHNILSTNDDETKDMPVVGDIIRCTACLAEHEVVPDGVILKGVK